MSMTLIRPFGPLQNNNTVNLAVTASNQTLTITPSGIGYRSIRVVNAGTQTVFLKFGSSASVASTTTSLPMLANTVEVFVLDNDTTAIAAIAGSTGSTIYVDVGQGI